MLRCCLLIAATLAFLAVPARAAEKFLDIQEVTSPGGITAWLVENHDLPIIALEFAYKNAGSAHDPVDKQGLARMLSNTLDEGAGDLDSQAFQKALSDNSISLSFGASRDDFTGSLKTLTRKKNLAFDLLRKALAEPRFDQEAVDRMRAANEARIRSSLSDPDWIAARILNDTAFAGHPYALNSGGTLTTLQNITPDDLRKFKKDYFYWENLAVVVVGDITAADLKITLDQIFTDTGAFRSMVPPQVKDITVQNGGQTVFYKKDIPQTMLEIMQPGIGRDDPDYHAYQVMNFILGGSGFGSRLTEEVREKRGLTYGIFSQFYLLDHLKGLSVSTSTDNKHAEEALSLIRQEFEKMRSAPITAQELADAKSYITGSMPLALSSTDGIAGMLLGLRLDHLPIDYLDTLKDKINAVTVADVQRVAQRLLQPDQLTIAVVGKPEGVTPTKTLETLPNAE